MDGIQFILMLIIHCVRYWLKLTRMDVSRLPFKAYKMLCDLDKTGNKKWVSNVGNFLSAHGLMYVGILKVLEVLVHF